MPALAVPSLSASQSASSTPGKPAEKVVQEAVAQWLFTEEEVTHPPSVQDGISLNEERERRSKGVGFIQQVGLMLKLPQLTISTATVFFHRFLMRHSLKGTKERKALHHYEAAGTAVFIATKTEENIRRLKDIIVACCRVAQKNPNLVVDEQSKDFWRWRDTLMYNEDVLLEILCFDLTVENAHMLCYELMKELGTATNKEIRNPAWAFISDSNFTTLCLVCSPMAIAVSAVYFGCKQIGMDPRMPDLDNAEGQTWWEQREVTIADIVRGISCVCDYYTSTQSKSSGGKNIYDGIKHAVQADYDSEVANHEDISPQQAHEPPEDEDTRGVKRAGEEEQENGRAHKKVKGDNEAVSSSANGAVLKVHSSPTKPDAEDEAGSEEGEVEE